MYSVLWCVYDVVHKKTRSIFFATDKFIYNILHKLYLFRFKNSPEKFLFYLYATRKSYILYTYTRLGYI